MYAPLYTLQTRDAMNVRCINSAVTRRYKKAWCEVRCEDLIYTTQASVCHVHMVSPDMINQLT